MRAQVYFRNLAIGVLTAAVSTGGLAAGSVEPDAEPAVREDVLRGPRVENAGPPGVPEKFGEAMQREPGEAGQRVPMRVFGRAIRSLRSPEDASLGLTPEQAESIREVMRAYREDVREALAQRERPAGDVAAEDGKAPAKPSRSTQRSRRDRLQGQERAAIGVEAMRSLGEAMPDAASYQRQVWAVLSADQRAVVEAVLERELEAERERRAERMAEMASDGKEKATDAARERFRSMTPEQRRELIERARDRSRLEREQRDAKKSGTRTDGDT